MFSKEYPYVSSWISTTGWIEIGQDEYSSSMLRIINEGGIVWEDTESNTIEESLKRAEKYLKDELLEEFGFELDID